MAVLHSDDSGLHMAGVDSATCFEDAGSVLLACDRGRGALRPVNVSLHFGGH